MTSGRDNSVLPGGQRPHVACLLVGSPGFGHEFLSAHKMAIICLSLDRVRVNFVTAFVPLPLVAGADGKSRPVQMPRIFFGADDSRNTPVPSHCDLALTTIGAWSSRGLEVDLVGPHVHLDHFCLQKDCPVTGQCSIGIFNNDCEGICAKLARVDHERHRHVVHFLRQCLCATCRAETRTCRGQCRRERARQRRQERSAQQNGAQPLRSRPGHYRYQEQLWA